MSSGYQDYVRNVAPEFTAPGINQTLVFEENSENIASSATGTIITYTIPAGYNLHILHVGMSTFSPALNSWYIEQSGTFPIIQIFEVQAFHFFGGAMVIYRSDGATINIKAVNWDDVTQLFNAVLRGFLQPINP